MITGAKIRVCSAMTGVFLCLAGSGRAEFLLNQICQATVSQGVVWQDKNWSPSEFPGTVFGLKNAPLEDCFRFGAPHEQQSLEQEAEFLNTEQVVDIFRNHSAECILKTQDDAKFPELYACIRKERAEDGQITYDCKGLGWQLLYVTPDVGYNYSQISGATDPSLAKKGPMLVAAGTCKTAD